VYGKNKNKKETKKKIDYTTLLASGDYNYHFEGRVNNCPVSSEGSAVRSWAESC
jgi:hypothetical protein